jgi:hypothetical protein
MKDVLKQFGSLMGAAVAELWGRYRHTQTGTYGAELPAPSAPPLSPRHLGSRCSPVGGGGARGSSPLS